MMKQLAIFPFAIALLCFSVGAPALAQTTSEQEISAKEEAANRAIQPHLQVPIPGFKPDTVVIGNGNNGCDKGDVCVYTIGAYLNAVYKWSASVAALLAIVLLMIGGVEYMIGSAVGSIERAKQRIRNSSFGLLLVFATTVILSFINPDITALSAIKLPIVEPGQDISLESLFGGSTPVTTNIVPPGTQPGPGQVAATTEFQSSPYLFHSSGVLIHPEIIDDLRNVGLILFNATNANNHVHVASAYRSSRNQANTWLTYCMGDNRTGSFTCNKPVCNPWPRTNAESPFDSDNHRSGPWTLKASINEAYPDDASLANYLRQEAIDNGSTSCPHLTGTTVDVWCGPRKASYVDNVTCHMALEDAMRATGFRRLDSEVWHFEHNSNLSSASTIRGGAASGTQNMAGRCNADRHGPQCVFNYQTCRADNGGSDYANFEKGCCSDSNGVCCDTGSANVAECLANAN